MLGLTTSTQGGAGLAWTGAIIYVAAFFLAGFWMIGAQVEYVRLYQRRRDAGLARPDDLAARYSDEPGRWATESFALSWRLWKIVWQPQQDATLERARRRVVRRWWLTVAVMFLGAPALVVVSALTA